jgi:type II secretory pathway component PulK
MSYPSLTTRTRARPAVVLLAVLVVLVLLTLAAYEYSELMTAEYRAADSYARAAQARALAESGVHFAAAALGNPDTFTNTLGSNPFNNATAFQGVLVRTDTNPRLQGRFSIIAPPDPDQVLGGVTGPYNYGVSDEAGKINLNALLLLDSSGQVAHDMLLLLPNMTEDVADAMLDWIDSDEQPRAAGAESDYYSSLTPPYHSKNAALDSLEELLLVRGVTPQLLLGNDRNRNGQYDLDENDGTGALNLGWAAYLTPYSREPNADSNGNQRIYVNGQDLNGLYQSLQSAVGPNLAVYIVAYRMYGPAAAGGTASAGANLSLAALGNLSSASGRLRSISSLFELVNTSVSLPGNNPRQPPTRYPSPLNDQGTLRQLLPQLLDKVSTSQNAVLPGRINVNTAPRAVLTALPGLADADVQSILQHRPALNSQGAPDPTFQTTAWLLTEANLQPKQMQTLDQYVTARSRVFRIQSVGYFDGGGPTARIEAVIDAAGIRPRIVYWRDLTELGKGFNLTGPGASHQ